MDIQSFFLFFSYYLTPFLYLLSTLSLYLFGELLGIHRVALLVVLQPFTSVCDDEIM